MNKRLIHFDQQKFNRELSVVKLSIAKLRKAIDEINAIGSYRVTSGGLNDFLHSHGEVIQKGIEKAAETELEKAGIKSSSVRAAAIKGDIETFYRIYNAYNAHPKPEYEVIRFYIIGENGDVSIDPKTEEVLREENSLYISTEKGEALFDAQERFLNALNDITKLVPSMRFMVSRGVVEYNEEQRTFVPSLLDYDRLTTRQ
ncbi:hypothetical protein F5984_15160 [Rudanella paleaurantiibacter]|uniref:Uncharacterized protein n=1 Tax=Rudanella paleaurantiibacter TaxID=2614655 RepID=A0A7J5TZB8_9BACT|nr:hypothetical protein [Rudanella paleaurantiibacter]KAB7730479.1 hypothetical protein F5984_15160 [Rudanella paleaurantiibacter]